MRLTVTGIAQRPSVLDSVITFTATNDAGNEVVLAVDHRIARDLFVVLAAEGEVVVEAEDWQVLR